MTKLTSDQKRSAIKLMAKDLMDFRFNDQNTPHSNMENYFFDNLVDEYLSIHMPKIVNHLKSILEHNGEERSYGDYDLTIKVINQSPSKVVLYLEDHCSCASETRFLVFIKLSGNNIGTIHFRTVWGEDKTDYVKGNKYVHRPNFKWYEDRQFNLEYKESLHMTPLGGSYEDCRDQGFIFSADKPISTDNPEELKKIFGDNSDILERLTKWNIERGTIYQWGKFQFVARLLANAFYEIHEEEFNNYDED